MFIKESTDNYWMLSWLDQYMMGHKGFIAGGCFKNIFNKEKVKDLDIFFHSRSDFDAAVQYYDEKTAGYSEDGISYLGDEEAEYRFAYENDSVKAYVHKKTNVRIELCRKVFGTVEDILSRFDFTITKFAYYKEEVDEAGVKVDSPFEDISETNTHIEYKVIMHEKFFEHLHLKRLVTDDKILFPMSTFERAFRYARYGYFPCKETKMKMAKAINELPKKGLQVSEVLYDGMY